MVVPSAVVVTYLPLTGILFQENRRGPTRWSFTTDLPSKLKPEEKSSGKWMDQMDGSNLC